MIQSSPSIAEIESGILDDEERFRRDIVEPCRPVVLRGAFAQWPVVRTGGKSFQDLRNYLARFANDRQAEAFLGDPRIGGRYSYADNLDGFNFERVNIDLLGALDKIFENTAKPGAPSVYVGSMETDLFLPGFAGEHQINVVPKSISPRIWIGNASFVSCHNDNFDNIACVVAGRRTFTLYPPEATPDLYVGPIDHTMAGRPVSLAASAPDDPRFPRFAAAAKMASIVQLNPGDALYVPKLWWHQVEATEPFNVLINYWWDAFSAGPDAPYTAMLHALIAIAERPVAERLAWKALFDHYVFREHGHPLAHLPEAQHGILGPLRDNYGRIRAHVMRMMRG